MPEALRASDRLWGRVRATGEPSPCVVTEADGERFAVEFDAPQFAPALGQHLVLYDESGYVVGGGVICTGR